MVEKKPIANLTELLLYAKPDSLILSEPGKSPEWSCLRGLNKRKSVQKPKFRVLSLDGGGILGLAAAMMVERLEADLGKPANQIFDMFIGTSTGGILSVGLAAGIPASRLVKLYEENGEDIFKKKGLFGLRGYSKDGLRKFLETELATVEKYTMSDLTKVKCAVETCLLLEEKGDASGLLLNNWNDLYNDVSLVEACLATSSAPTYFKAQKIKLAGLEASFVDGGVTMNNPALLAKTSAEEFVGNPKTDLFMLSISTGFIAHELNPAQDFITDLQMTNKLRWKANGVNYCMSSNCRQASIVAAESFPRDDFFRFNPEALAGQEMDDVSEKAIQAIKEVGKAIIDGTEFQNLVKRLKEVSP